MYYIMMQQCSTKLHMYFYYLSITQILVQTDIQNVKLLNKLYKIEMKVLLSKLGYLIIREESNASLSRILYNCQRVIYYHYFN